MFAHHQPGFHVMFVLHEWTVINSIVLWIVRLLKFQIQYELAHRERQRTQQGWKTFYFWLSSSSSTNQENELN